MSQVPITADDLDAFFVEGEFAQSVLTQYGAIIAIVLDIGEREYEGGTVGVEGSTITVIAKSSDVALFVENESILVGTPAENLNMVNKIDDNTGKSTMQFVRGL